MAALYIKSLLPELAQHVTLGQAHLSPHKCATIDHAANLARRMYAGRHSSKECQALSSLQTGGNAGKVVKFAGSSSAGRAAGSSGGLSSSGKKNCFKCGFIP
ncbi:hypothetical protein INT45_001978 [Circinella minor]|uniref:Uncharacterized protein n=1 Tax=Circinella minor TaxID=1195481 RepID=A0A8H7RSX2_9FUNG|nr:hypothetical protein INT45_001978 [Circinella minor]